MKELILADFTQKQGQYLAFIYAYTTINGRPPAETDMQRFFGVSPPSAHRMVVELETKGLLTRTPGAPRSIRIVLPPDSLPVLEDPTQSIKTPVGDY